jgi:hypothetical protein
LPPIDLAFIDGNHSFADVRHDFLATLRYTHRNSYLLLHDTNIYVRELVRHAGVKRRLRVACQRNISRSLIFRFPPVSLWCACCGRSLGRPSVMTP